MSLNFDDPMFRDMTQEAVILSKEIDGVHSSDLLFIRALPFSEEHPGERMDARGMSKLD